MAEGFNFDQINKAVESGGDATPIAIAGVDAQESAPATGEVSKSRQKRDFTKRIEGDFRSFYNSLDAEGKKKFKSRVNDFAVTKTLGFGGIQTFVQLSPQVKDKNGVVIAERKLENGVTGVVGYMVKNLSKKPIDYVDEECFLDKATGRWDTKPVNKTLAPGAEAPMSRKTLAIFATKWEIAMELSNGKIFPCNAVGVAKDLEGSLDKFRFVFKDGTPIHDPKVKVLIHNAPVTEVVNGKEKKVYTVKAEYESTFGYLNNINIKKSKRGSSGSSVDSTDGAFALYVSQMLNKKGIIPSGK